jgi:hypothetical protein
MWGTRASMGITRSPFNWFRPRRLFVASTACGFGPMGSFRHHEQARLRVWIPSALVRISTRARSEDGPREDEEGLRRDTTGNGPTDKQREKRKGIASESLVASTCVLGSDGELNVATSLVDDEGRTSSSTGRREDPRFPSK